MPNHTLHHRFQKTKMLALGAVVAAAALGAPATSEAAPQLGLKPGVWKGTGAISGSDLESGMTTRFTGRFRFTLTVRRNLSVAGSASWRMTMQGSGHGTSSTIRGAAKLRASGIASAPRLKGTLPASGTITSDGVSFPINMKPIELNKRLVITRGGVCRALGKVPMGPGVKARWSATLSGARCMG